MNTQKLRVEKTFAVLDSMEKLRDVWRECAPLGNLDGEQRAAAEKHISKARAALEQMEGTL